MTMVRYTGETKRMLVHQGVTYEVKPGDEPFEIDGLLELPDFEVVPDKPNKPSNLETKESQTEGDDEV